MPIDNDQDLAAASEEATEAAEETTSVVEAATTEAEAAQPSDAVEDVEEPVDQEVEKPVNGDVEEPASGEVAPPMASCPKSRNTRPPLKCGRGVSAPLLTPRDHRPSSEAAFLVI